MAMSNNQMVYPKFEVFDHETGQKQQHQGIELTQEHLWRHCGLKVGVWPDKTMGKPWENHRKMRAVSLLLRTVISVIRPVFAAPFPILQWPLQEPKFEVSMYKAYVRSM